MLLKPKTMARLSIARLENIFVECVENQDTIAELAREHNIRKSELVHDEPVHDEPVQNEPVHNVTKESRVNAPSFQTTTQRDVTREAQTGRPPISTFARQSVRPPMK
ncbi:hypothetical protein LIER_38108 [Lithospermum erythrorhizon]|uniref:Uncharacterized protein n=1 Tax=Lithospermum erythrorhizon TaxID=34254 RepID=A0AAV3PWW6_LITER